MFVLKNISDGKPAYDMRTAIHTDIYPVPKAGKHSRKLISLGFKSSVNGIF